MDGNYDADNVYFNSDILVTEPIGTIKTLINGQATLAAKGKNLSSVFSSLMAERKNPEVENPSATIKLTNNGNKNYFVEIGTNVSPAWETTFSKGVYSYGPVTGCESILSTVELEGTNLSNNIEASALNGASGILENYVVEDTAPKSLKLTYGYTASAENAKDNFGDGTDIAILEASGLIAYSENYIQGYRNSFYGSYTTKENTGTTSESIRTLKTSEKTLENGSTIFLEIPKGALRVVIAYPADLQDMSEVLDKNDSETNIISAFGEPDIVPIKSANDFDEIDYKVYHLDFANPYDTNNIFIITI